MNNKNIILIIIIFSAGLGGGYWMASNNNMAQDTNVSGAEDTSNAAPLYYRHPMNPDVTSPVPVKDDMGMDYVAVYADGGNADEPAGTVTIDPVVVQNIGVRTALVKQGVFSRTVRAVGRIDFDEQRLARVHPKTEGWIEKLRVDKTGEQVKKGDILLSIYSPQLVSSQEEYLLALKNKEVLANSPFAEIKKGAEDLVRSARERLELLDVPEHQIRELEKTGKRKKFIHIHSPFTGVVMHVGARNGQFVGPKTELYRLADLSRVWVYVDIFEDDLSWVRQGDEAEMFVSAVPGRIFRGTISYIYPFMEENTRTVKVRMEFDNKEGLLKPKMFADVSIHTRQKKDVVMVPSEAVIRSGDREQVFVVRGPGKFAPRLVTLGVSNQGMVQIIKGLKVGEQVVTSAQFLIDSESRLREATAKMLEAIQIDSEVDSEVDSQPDSGSGNGENNDARSGQDMSEMNMDMDGDQSASDTAQGMNDD